MLVFWFWQEIVVGVTYVLSVQYSCAVVSVFWLWQKIVEHFFYKKILLGFFILEKFWTGVSGFSVTLFYSTLLALTDRQKD